MLDEASHWSANDALTVLEMLMLHSSVGQGQSADAMLAMLEKAGHWFATAMLAMLEGASHWNYNVTSSNVG